MKSRVYNTVDWRKYLIPENSKRVQAFLESNGDDVFHQLSLLVCKAIKRKNDSVVVIVHPNAGNAILIKEDEYEEFFEIANKWFLKKEKYEMCNTIKEHLLIFNSNKSPKKQSKIIKSLS